MKKKFINSLKLGSLLGFVSNNIKADYKLALIWATDYMGFEVDLKGDNDTILNDPTKCYGKFDDILKTGNETLDSKHRFKPVVLKDIKKNFIPIYYKLKDSKDFILISDNERNPDGSINFNTPENVEEVYYILNNTATNKVTCSVDPIREYIESKKFVIDDEYIYKVIFNESPNFSDLDDVKKHFYIKIEPNVNNNTYNIEIIFKYIFKISDTEEFKISEKDVKDKDFITPLNKLKNLYIATIDINNVFDKYIIKKEAIKYIFEYNKKKYYIISDKKLKGEELFEFLQTKEDLKGKELIFDSTTPLEKNLADNTVAPGKYKLIDNVMPKKPEEKPEEKPNPNPQTYFKYNFTGDKSLSKWIEKDFVTNQKVNVQSLFNDQDTSKYVFVAIKEGTNERFINDQIIEPGTYELKREEKHKEDDKGQGQQQGQEHGDEQNPKKAQKMCGCC